MIRKISVHDRRFPLSGGAGSDAIHRNPCYSYTVTQLVDEKGSVGTGLAFTLGAGNELVCQAAKFYAEQLQGKAIEELMAHFGDIFNQLSNEQQFRWLGPHKGVVHLALASVTNACFDLWAKTRQLPLWKLLIELTPQQLMNTLDLSYLEDVLTEAEALAILHQAEEGREMRKAIVQQGYPGYDTSIGWFNYSEDKIKENIKKAINEGFDAMKLKVGSTDMERDIRRAHLVREVAGDEVKIMLDANQQWTLPRAIIICQKLRSMQPYWIEEPTHPDDILAHETLARTVAPIKLALGEHVPNRIVFKNYLQTGSAGFIQVDAVRVGGISEFITISLLCKKFNVPVVPHVGDMGQLHQHLVLFNHICLGHEALFLEHIPHLRSHFVHPASVRNGKYLTPMEIGSSCDLKEI